MIGSAIAEYNVAISSELHWLFLLDFKWSFLLVFVWLFSPGSNRASLRSQFVALLNYQKGENSSILTLITQRIIFMIKS